MSRDDIAVKIVRGFAEAASGNRVDIPTALRNSGWGTTYSAAGGDLPLRERLNQVICELTAFGVEINTQGIPEWDARVNYGQYAYVQCESALYRSRTATGPDETVDAVNPCSDGQMTWQVLLGQNTVAEAPVLTAVAGTNRVSVRWTEPFNGGSPILAYTLEWKSGAQSYISSRSRITTADQRSLDIGGLTNGTQYTFRVRAVNANGNSEWSSEAVATPFATVPGAPGLRLDAGRGQIEATIAVPDGGGLSIDSYELQYKSGAQSYSSSSRQVSFSGASRVVTGLSNGTQYTMRVRARNRIGPGPWSSDVSATPMAVRASQPDLTATAGDEFVDLAASVDDDGDSPVSAYTFQWKSGNQSFSTTRQRVQSGSSYRVPNLTNGTQYTFRVRATNSIGDSQWSSERTARPRPDIVDPGVPGLAVTRRDSGANVVITAGSTGNGSVSHEVQWRSELQANFDANNRQVTTTGLSVTLTSLTNGTLYYVRVRAVNEVGNSAWSTVRTVTPATTPGRPGLSVVRQDEAAALTITPAGDGGDSITGYVIQWKSGDQDYDTTRQRVLTSTTPSITSLGNGVEYTFRVAARNTVGDSPFSVERTVTPATTAGVPGLTVSRGNARATLRITDPADLGGLEIVGYVVQWKSGAQEYNTSTRQYDHLHSPYIC